MTFPRIVSPDESHTLISIVRDAVSKVVSTIPNGDPEERNALAMNLIVQALGTPELWMVDSVNAAPIAFNIGCGVGARTGDFNAESADQIMTQLVAGYWAGRGETLRARADFPTKGTMQ